MTETHVLIAGFLIVFGFGGYKLANVIKNFLDKYSSNVAGRIHDSEQLKLKAVIAFDEINKRAETINDEVVKMKTDVNKQMEQIQKGFQEKADKVADRIIKNNKERIEADKKELIEKTTKTIQECVIRYITEYNKQTPKEQTDKNIINMLLKVDFKKLLND
jgi:F0F1-type ATP synthase membrane subunit b/b'